jgi:hypothetical protein
MQPTKTNLSLEKQENNEEFNPVEYMVAQGSKKLADSNKKVIKDTFTVATVIYSVLLVCVGVLKRPSPAKPFILIQLPVVFFLYSIYMTGWPTYYPSQSNPKQMKLVRAGDDLKTHWLMQYYFDIIYITWFLDILVVVFNNNKIFYVYGIIPAFVAYKFVAGIFTYIVPMYAKPHSKVPINEVK